MSTGADNRLTGSSPGIRLLLVEDDPGDELLLAAEFAEAKLVIDTRVVRTVTHALAVLESGNPTWPPDLVLVDVDLRGVALPAMTDLARYAHRARAWVAVMTGSEIEQRILKGWSVPADLYVRKPVDLRAMVDIVRGTEDLSLLVMRTPGTAPAGSTRA
jgi:two-component system, response regulator